MLFISAIIPAGKCTQKFVFALVTWLRSIRIRTKLQMQLLLRIECAKYPNKVDSGGEKLLGSSNDFLMFELCLPFDQPSQAIMKFSSFDHNIDSRLRALLCTANDQTTNIISICVSV